MNTPSVKTIMQITRVTAEQAKLAKFAFNATLDEIEEKFPVTAAWMRTCYHAPTRIHAMMNACDEAIGTYGIESTEGRNGRSLEYCNTGDSYLQPSVSSSKKDSLDGSYPAFSLVAGVIGWRSTGNVRMLPEVPNLSPLRGAC